jgi:ribosome-associated protein
MKEILINSVSVELYKILKFEGIAASGGEAKALIAEGQVLLNGQVEIRKRKKIFAGDVIEFGGEKFSIRVK